MGRIILVLCLLSVPLSAVAQAPEAKTDEAVTPAAEPKAPSPQDTVRARELYKLGDQLYNEGRYAAAITTFKESYRLSAQPLLLFNIANAQERSGNWSDAADTLRRYREFAFEQEKPSIDQRIASIENRVQNQISEFEKERLELQRQKLEAEERQKRLEEAERLAALREAKREALRHRRNPKRAGGIALLAIGGISLVSGIGLAIASRTSKSDALSQCTQTEPVICPTSAQSAIDQTRRRSIGADLLVGIGLAALVGGVILLIKSKRAEEKAVGPTLSLTVGDTTALTLSGHF